MSIAKQALELMMVGARECGLDEKKVALASTEIASKPMANALVGESEAKDLVFCVGFLIGQVLAQLPDDTTEILSAGMTTGDKVARFIRSAAAEASN